MSISCKRSTTSTRSSRSAQTTRSTRRSHQWMSITVVPRARFFFISRTQFFEYHLSLRGRVWYDDRYMVRKHKKRKRYIGSLERDILEELTFGDLLHAHLLSGTSRRHFYKLARGRAAYRYRRKLAIERLVDSEFIQERGERLEITQGGRSAFGEAISETLILLETREWDHKWRIVSFDIPERYASLRDKVRRILKKAGFVKLQHSIWIFPHECGELVQLIKEESRLSQYILYGVLEKIEDEPRLKKLFGLK